MKVALVSLTGCEGCFYNLLCEEFEELITKHGVEVVEWRLLGAKTDSHYDVAIVEGSVASTEDVYKLQLARSRSRYLVAVGSCAVLGGVQACTPTTNVRSKPVGAYVKVDYYVRGCPAKPEEVLRFLKLVFRGLALVRYEARFEPVERPTLRVTDARGFLALDTSKCVVCGRCVELCKSVNASVLNYVYRGIHTVVSTPYGEPFDKSGCIFCGLCSAYCPAGAVSYAVELDRVNRCASDEIYVEPEALAALAESENAPLHAVLATFEHLGFKKVVVYFPLAVTEPGRIYAKSPAELELAKKFLKGVEVELLEPKIPSDSVYVTQCLAWRRVLNNAITTRELQLLVRNVFRDTGLSQMGEPRSLTLEIRAPRSATTVHSLTEVKEASKLELGDPVVFEVCPGGCLMGGGQPLSRDHYWRDILEKRQLFLREILSTSFASMVNS